MLDVFLVVLRNSAASAAVAAIAAVFFKSVANCVENMNNRRKIRHDRSYNCVEIIFRRKIRHDVSYNRVEMDFRRKLPQIFIFFL